MTIIASIYPGPHDANICILQDGEILINLELERFSRVKKDGGFTLEFFHHCLDNCGIGPNDIDVFVIDGQYFNYYKSDLPKLFTEYDGVPIGDFEKLKSSLSYQGSVVFNGRRLPFISIQHHLAHAASAFYTSPFENASIITADAGGTGVNFSISLGKDGQIIPLRNWWRWTAALGYWWSKIPYYYGVKEPGTLMAISAYGKHNPALRAELLSQIITTAKQPLNDHFIHIDRKFDENSGVPLKPLDPKINGDADLAYALQSITDEIFAGWFAQASKLTGNKNICFSGGLALNCIGNTRAVQLSNSGTLHVPPNANDSGLAMGAALAVYYGTPGNIYKPKYFNPYQGAFHNDSIVNSAIEQACKRHQLKRLKVNDIAESVSSILENRKIICRYKGRSEAGPRALGNRSFLAAPDIPNLRKTMNKVKKREWYRPFAPIVLGSKKDEIFDTSVENSYYMNTSSVVREKWRKSLEGVLHSDNTTRPQIVDNQTDQELYQIVNNFYDKTSIPAILNTSFNINEPLVEKPDEAINTFIAAGKDVEYMQIENEILQKAN